MMFIKLTNLNLESAVDVYLYDIYAVSYLLPATKGVGW